MKNFTTLFIACLFCLATGFTQVQPVFVSPKSIENKSDYVVKVFLMDGRMFKGKLLSCSDSAITVYLEIYTDMNHYTTDQVFEYSKIDEIILVQRMKGIGPLIGGLAGLTSGLIYALGVSAANEVNTWFGEGEDISGAVIGGIFLGTAVGLAVGTGIESATRQRYRLPVYGDYDAFAGYCNDLKLMAFKP